MKKSQEWREEGESERDEGSPQLTCHGFLWSMSVSATGWTVLTRKTTSERVSDLWMSAKSKPLNQYTHMQCLIQRVGCHGISHPKLTFKLYRLCHIISHPNGIRSPTSKYLYTLLYRSVSDTNACSSLNVPFVHGQKKAHFTTNKNTV